MKEATKLETEPPSAEHWPDIRRVCRRVTRMTKPGYGPPCKYPFCTCAHASQMERELAERELASDPRPEGTPIADLERNAA